MNIDKNAKIANPVYDVVFKYLMEDARVAKIFLSVLIGREILDLKPLPQELSVSQDEQPGVIPLTTYRLDFSARIKLPNGDEKLILIEIQKSKMYHDSMRFRKYLGKQYMNPNFFQVIPYNNNRQSEVGIPILSIYFLGHILPGLESHPVLYIKNKLTSRYSQKEIQIINPFIESLYHEGIIITIPALQKTRRDNMERLLSIFDQSNRTKDIHIMNVKVQDFPKQFRPIIQRLQRAVQGHEIRETMEVEDDFFNEIMDYEERVNKAERKQEEAQRNLKEAQEKQIEAQRKQEEAQRKQEEAQRKQKEAQREQEKAQREQEKAQREQEKAQREQEKAQREQEKAQRKQKIEAQRMQRDAILLMIQSGISKETISQSLGLSIDDIVRIVNKRD